MLLTYGNSWTLDASVGRWTLETGPWTLDFRRWTLDAGPYTLDAELWALHNFVDYFRTEASFRFCVIKLLRILWMRISKDLMATLACSVEAIGSTRIPKKKNQKIY